MSTRLAYFSGFLIICGLLLTSLYLQFYQGIMPCPLCSLQRLTFILLGIIFLIGSFISGKKWGAATIHLLSILTSSLGMFLSGRQIWLQHYPNIRGNECGVSLQYMLKVLPLNEVAQKIFEGSAECSQRAWEFLSFDMADWALAWFSLFFIGSLYLLWKTLTSKHEIS